MSDEEKGTKNLQDDDIVKSKTIIRFTPESVKDKTDCWMSAELRLNDFSIKQQTFSITGWINVCWIWHRVPNKLADWEGASIDDGSDTHKMSKMIMYENEDKDKIVKVMDLRDSNITYYLPISAKKIFFQPSLICIHHIDPPCLYYNKRTKYTHSQFYINATLLEQLELFLFPFDRQFLNIKLRWNIDYYRILDFEQDKNLPLKEKWWGKEGRMYDRSVELYHTKPLKVSLKESIANEVKLFDSWVDFRPVKSHSKQSANLRFALIRLRARREPMYFVSNIIFPFFIIVSCSFSVFAIDMQNIGDRLSVSVTILLTFTAFQNIVSDELPHTSSMLLIDYYIGIAYLLQALLILGSCVIPYIENTDGDNEETDKIYAIVLGSIWALVSLFYMSLKSELFRNCYDQCCCCCLRSVNYNDWDKRGHQEIRNWADNQKTVDKFKIVRDSRDLDA